MTASALLLCRGSSVGTRRAAMDEIIDWLVFYNRTRLHQTLGYVSPMLFEQRWTQASSRTGKPHHRAAMEP
jgi:transposase InsO family protein